MVAALEIGVKSAKVQNDVVRTRVKVELIRDTDGMR
jgi:hypothetical protein